MNSTSALQLYRSMRTARCIDEVERELVARGEAFFQVSAAGHEASAAIAPYLFPEDFLHCHYRDKALLLARGVPVVEFFNSLLCNGASHSFGRQMSAHLSAPRLNVLSMVGPVGNNALQAAGIAHEVKDRPGRPVVLCSLGDGSTQQGEVLEAIAEAVRWQLPVLFLVENNRYSISTRTAGKTFYSLPTGDAEHFYGLPIERVDGTDPLACAAFFERLVSRVRTTRSPTLCVMSVERLVDHTNADDESVYRDPEELSRIRQTGDPVASLRERLCREGIKAQELERIDATLESDVRAAAADALDQPPPPAIGDVQGSSQATTPDQIAEYRGRDAGPMLTMNVAMREALRSLMDKDPRVTLYGEDIEDPKGDVFGVTRGLTSQFPGRVANSPLSEATIIGTSIGRALAGGRPVAFVQFADFLPLAFNQLASELGTLAWRTNGGWRAPVIVMVTCGGYRPGLGPFHAATFDSAVAHLPGIDVAVPSTATDAAGALNAAFLGGRPTVVFYPKALLNDSSRAGPDDVSLQIVPIGKARVIRPGTDITLVGWGNAVPLLERVAATLDAVGAGAEVVDLRWLAPWDRDTVLDSVRKTSRLLVVHEDNRSAGFGAEVIASVAETLGTAVRCERVTRPDTFIPCHFGNQLEILPSYRTVLTSAANLCGFEVTWEEPVEDDESQQIISAIGSSPSDQSVQVVEIHVGPGESVKTGQVVASVEADKAIVDIASPVDGLVEAIHLQTGDRAPVDSPLITLRVAQRRRRQPTREISGTPALKSRPRGAAPMGVGRRNPHGVALIGLGAVRGRARLHNSELLHRFRDFASSQPGNDGILERTGIESRVVADPTQDAVTMATEAATLALAEAGVDADDLTLAICSTTTPVMISPSTACLVLHRLAPHTDIAAFDLQAACSGYLYALTCAWDYLQSHPEGKVLVLTTETMRRIVDVDDADTSPLFADAATATVLAANLNGHNPLALLHRPVISARGEDGSTLRVPLPQPGAYVHMEGKRIFVEAIRRMTRMLESACAQADLSPSDLDLVVPHQANGRIIEAMRSHLKLPSDRVWNEIRLNGNTSSSSIPLALDSVFRRKDVGARIGLCAFGAGYTFGGAVLQKAHLRVS